MKGEMSKKTIKPPLGLRPKSIAEEDRFIEVHEAIGRYWKASLVIPIAWIKEYNKLVVKVDLIRMSANVNEN